MNTIKSIIYFLTLSLLIVSCGKKEAVEPPEEDLKISTIPAIGNDIAGALSNTFNFKLVINSKPPKNGVKIDISVKNDLDNSVSYTQSTQTSTNTISTIDLQIDNLVPGNLYTATTEVTSLSKPTNKTQIVFKVARK
jgi:hypothetical protein